MIWFVGAGCYHEDMITLAAIKVLKIADCVCYDHLVNKELLRYCQDCELINVGKIGHGSSFKQEDINRLLVEKSKIYHHVVRLKGGDPYLFGRGSEEMLYCLEHGIDCQYIPGISSLGGLGYAGIALTHRGLASGFSVHTLHYQDGKDHLDYDLIAKDNNTHIFFMGASKIKQFVTNCLQHGKDPNTSIALVKKASYPDQKVMVSTLDKILTYDISEYTNPLLIALGDVCKLQQDLDNTKRLQAYGKKVLLLYVDEGFNSDMLLLENGITVSQKQVAKVLYECHQDVDLDEYEYLVFVSKHAYDGFIKYLYHHHKDIRVLNNKKIACIGQKTKEYIQSKGIMVDIVSDSSKNLFIDSHKVLWVDGNDHDLKDHLSVYRLFPLAYEIDDDYDVIGVTCPMAIESLNSKNINIDIALFSFGFKSYDKAVSLEFKNIIKCPSSKDKMLEMIIEYLVKG